MALLVPSRAEAAVGTPVVDVLTLSAYGVEYLSANDHVSTMTAGEPRPSCYTGGTPSAWYQITTSLKGQMGPRLMDYTGVYSIALYQGTSFADVVELSCVSFPSTSYFLQPYVRASDSLDVQVIADGPYSVSAVIGPTRFIDNFADAEDLSVGFLNFGYPHRRAPTSLSRRIKSYAYLRGVDSERRFFR